MAQIGDETALPDSDTSSYELPSSWVGVDSSTPRDPSPLKRGYGVKGPKQPSQASTEEAGRKLLKSFGERFVKEVRAKGNLAFTAKLHRQDVIPEDIQNKVEEAHSHDSANSILLKFLSHQSTCESLRKLITIMAEAKDNPAMSLLGRDMRLKMNLLMPVPSTSPVAAPGQRGIQTW